MPVQCYYQNYNKNGGVSNLDKIRLVGLKIQDRPMVKEGNPKVEGGAKPKWRRFQQSTSTRKASFKEPMTRLKYKVFSRFC